jgi:hypothetical protein
MGHMPQAVVPLGGTLIIRTNHYTVKFMLDQHLSIILQPQWISKLFGFNFKVMYHLDRLNTVCDALSIREMDDAHALVQK